jgi:hypothetical protein
MPFVHSGEHRSGGILVAQEVHVGAVIGRGRHAVRERYRGRHRKPSSQLKLGSGVRLAFTAACAALLVCLPQPSWADRTGTVHARTAAAGHAFVNGLPSPFRHKQHG